jgi:sn-glycerol 3-phosphate transport system substrate-binding protein
MKRLSAALGLGLALACATPAAAEPVTVTLWHSLNGNGNKLMADLVEGFNKSQTQYKIESSFTGGYEDTVVKLQAAFPARQQPDLMMLEVTRYGLFAGNGVLEPLDGYLAKETAAFRESFFPFALDAAKYLGKSYVLPFNVSTPVLYYNKEAFAAAGLDPEKPPKTWDELLTYSRKLTVRDGDTVKQWGIGLPAQFARWGFVRQAGGEWVDADNKVTIDQPEAIAAYRWLTDLVTVEKVGSSEAAIKENVAKQLFLSGQEAMNFGSTGDLGDVRGAIKFKFGVAPLPCGKVCAAPIGGATFGIAAASDQAKKDGAWAFLKYLSQPAVNAQVFARTGYLPILKGTADEPVAKAAIEAEPGYLVAVSQLPVAFARARPPAMAAIRVRENQVWEGIVLGQQTPEAALKAFGVEMRKMMTLP